MLTRAPRGGLRDADNELYESCFELSEAVRRLERAAGRPGSSAATAATLGCLTETFEALANALILLGDGHPRDGVARSHHERLRALLRTGSRNLRGARASADSARAVAGTIPASR